MEQIDVVNRKGKTLDVVGREQAIRMNLRHRIVCVMVFNSKGRVLVHRRSLNRKISPGLWGVGAGGAVSSGESFEHAAVRELSEELSIFNAPIEFLFDFSYEDDKIKYIAKIFKCIYDGKINFDKREMDKVAYKTVAAVQNMVKRGEMCPDTAIFFGKYLKNENK